MRVRKIQIGQWRNLVDVTLELSPDADFICLVGENGTGKSNLLELLAWAAPFFGISQAGDVVKRTLPPIRPEPLNIEVVLDVSDELTLEGVDPTSIGGGSLDGWDGTLVFRAWGEQVDPDPGPAGPGPHPLVLNTQHGNFFLRATVLAGGMASENEAFNAGQALVSRAQSRDEVLHLYIDSERVFPAIALQDADVVAAARQDTGAPQWIRQQAAIATSNLYLEWMRAMIGDQQRRQGEYYELARRAKEAREPIPEPEDPLDGYRASLTDVLPHLAFNRLDQSERRLIFDTAGEELPYEDLSGGEKELAFLVGQVERFGVTRGLFLLDEPELHLNAELLRRWIDYLRDSTETGQVWVATHALEVVETAGLNTTFVMERDADRRVRHADPLGDRPALATLAPLLGTPAFSLAASRFALIEGERPGRERERFARVLGSSSTDRFIESGGCREVLRRLEGLRAVASEAEQLRVGAFIDRDFRSDAQAAELEHETGVLVLPVHEIENLFLHPPLLTKLLEQTDQAGNDPHGLLRDVADARAGQWVWERTISRREWQEIPGTGIELSHQLAWSEIEQNSSELARRLTQCFDGDEATLTQRRAAFSETFAAYRQLRDDPDRLWKEMLGKQALTEVAARLGLADVEALESRAAHLWKTEALTRPPETESMTEYLQNLELVS
jgi:energy-coupling factor transporter ATP-binding protein EcfA2